MDNKTKIKIAELSGLIYQGIGEDGEPEFLGDDVAWNKYQDLLEQQ